MARSIAFREAIREALSEEMRRDERVFMMGEEVAEYNGAYKVSQGMLAEFGAKRIIDTPISELGFTAIGVGAAQNGLRPVVEFMTWNFAVLALDQILNTASKMLAMSGGQISCPIVFRGPNGSAGQLGAQHSTAFEALYANCLLYTSTDNFKGLPFKVKCSTTYTRNVFFNLPEVSMANQGAS